jgi:hypothetical protein
MARFGPWTIVLAVCVLVGGLGGTAAAASGAGALGQRAAARTAAGPAVGRPATGLRGKIQHVWIIELENAGYGHTFGDPSRDPELARVLAGKGALLKRYYGIGHDSLDNYVFTG